MNSPNTGVRFITAEETLPLRSRVLREGRPLGQCRFAEDGETGSFHLGHFGAAHFSETTAGTFHRPVGIASCCPKDLEGQSGRGIQLRGMAVAPEAQGTGVGREILHCAEGHVRAKRLADYLWCNARVSAILFYERHGWVVCSGEFEIPEVGPHRRMLKRL